MTVFRSDSLVRELERAILSARGREIAGLLLEDPAGAQRIELAPNLAAEPGEAEVPAWWLERALRRGGVAGFRAVAFLHSHLTSLELSETDRASMRERSLPWIVLLLREGRLTWAVYSGSPDAA
jgi:proteasome lid subunit RPN8/RPN11